jgi:large subunit ribosomal protein L18
LIDDIAGHTMVAASTLAAEAKKGNNKEAKKEAAQGVGAVIGKLALEKGIEKVVFDRGGYKYHGRVKALAEAVREAGLKF